jgi:hypothetical protein
MAHPADEAEQKDAAYWTQRGTEVIEQWKRKDWAPCGVCGQNDWYEHMSFTLCRVCLPPAPKQEKERR